MTEENKQPLEEAPEAAPEPQPEEPAEKAAKGKKKKEKGISFTREQVEQMEQAAKQAEINREHLVRVTAEYENYRKRTVKEKESLYQTAKADTIREFLAVYDNLERAANAEGGEDSPHKKGLEMIFAQYKDLLKKLGVTEMEAKGQPFDPERHNAVQRIEDENLGENEVAQVFQAGFLLGDKVIRHAVVQVANCVN